MIDHATQAAICAGLPWLIIVLAIGAMLCNAATKTVDYEHGPVSQRDLDRQAKAEQAHEKWIRENIDLDKYPRA